MIKFFGTENSFSHQLCDKIYARPVVSVTSFFPDEDVLFGCLPLVVGSIPSFSNQ
jgi:hypothetical protein